MDTHSAIVKELQDLLKNGATPSRLIQHIIARSSGETIEPRISREYFSEAFGVFSARLLQVGVDYARTDLRNAVLNRKMIPEIVELRASWDSSCQQSLEKGQCWLDGLVVTNAEKAKDEARLIPNGGLSQASWELLSPTEKDTIHLRHACIRTLTEHVTVLAVLAERLQQQIQDLELQIAGGST